MIKKTITYEDYNGNKRTEDFFFHLTKAEAIEMETSSDERLSDTIRRIINEKREHQLVALFKDVILKSYGVKSEDGRRFIKTPQLALEFSQTEAYSELFMELASDDKAAADFFNGIIPGVDPKLVEQTALELNLPITQIQNK